MGAWDPSLPGVLTLLALCWTLALDPLSHHDTCCGCRTSAQPGNLWSRPLPLNLTLGSMVSLGTVLYVPDTALLLWFYSDTLFFFSDFIYLFLDRGEGRETVRQRNHVWLPFIHPHLGTWPATQAFSLTRNRACDPLVHKLALNPLSHTSQGYSLIFLTCEATDLTS